MFWVEYIVIKRWRMWRRVWWRVWWCIFLLPPPPPPPRPLCGGPGGGGGWGRIYTTTLFTTLFTILFTTFFTTYTTFDTTTCDKSNPILSSRLFFKIEKWHGLSVLSFLMKIVRCLWTCVKKWQICVNLTHSYHINMALAPLAPQRSRTLIKIHNLRLRLQNFKIH